MRLDKRYSLKIGVDLMTVLHLILFCGAEASVAQWLCHSPCDPGVCRFEPVLLQSVG